MAKKKKTSTFERSEADFTDANGAIESARDALMNADSCETDSDFWVNIEEAKDELQRALAELDIMLAGKPS